MLPDSLDDPKWTSMLDHTLEIGAHELVQVVKTVVVVLRPPHVERLCQADSRYVCWPQMDLLVGHAGSYSMPAVGAYEWVQVVGY